MGARARLIAGLERLDLKLPTATIDQLLAYLDLLARWNRVYNLTAVRSIDDMVDRHILDSLAVIGPLRGAASLVDVGSGAGLPGIPLALACPELAVVLCESSDKKCAFLRQACITLGLTRITVYQGRAEQWAFPQRFDAVISRAFARLFDFVRLAGHLAGEQGRLWAMKAHMAAEETAQLPPDWQIVAQHDIAAVVPGGLCRQLVELRPVRTFPR
jgi:16S rRNA (guanine527-N7)-methyltransferase